jgi:hypothetical protein
MVVLKASVPLRQALNKMYATYMVILGNMSGVHITRPSVRLPPRDRKVRTPPDMSHTRIQYDPTTCTTVLPLSIMSISYYFISDFVRNKGTACEANTCYSPKDFAATSRSYTWCYSVNFGNIRATDVTTHLTLFCTMVQCWRRARVFPLGIWNHSSYTGLNYPGAFTHVCINQMLRTDPQYQHHRDPLVQNIP